MNLFLLIIFFDCTETWVETVFLVLYPLSLAISGASLICKSFTTAILDLCNFLKTCNAYAYWLLNGTLQRSVLQSAYWHNPARIRSTAEFVLPVSFAWSQFVDHYFRYPVSSIKISVLINGRRLEYNNLSGDVMSLMNCLSLATL